MKLVLTIALGITLGHLTDLRAAKTDAALPSPASATNTFLNLVTNHFAGWDLNGDGVLSTNELDAAVANPKITNNEAAAIAAFKRASRSAKTALPPLTVAFISQSVLRHETGQPEFLRMFVEGQKILRHDSNHSLFAEGGPRLDNIHQGRLGNCFSLAPLGAMVKADPKKVESMFSNETNGDYSVRLGKQIVMVAPPTDAELAMTSANENAGIWVNVYEKAVGEAQNEKLPPEKRLNSPIDALARGGSAGTMLAFITGHEMTRFSFKFAKDTNLTAMEFTNKLVQLREQLNLANREKRLMTCGTLKTTTPNLTPNHAYAVLAYQPEKDAVQLWNPHGQNYSVKGEPGPKTGYPTTNGIFSIPVTEFVRQFSGMAFEVAENPVKP